MQTYKYAIVLLYSLAQFGMSIVAAGDEKIRVTEIPKFDSIDKFNSYLDKLDNDSVTIAKVTNDSYFIVVRYRPGWIAILGHPRVAGLRRISFWPDIEPQGPILDRNSREKQNEMDFSIMHIRNNAGSSYYFGTWYPLPKQSLELDLEYLKKFKIDFKSALMKGIKLETFVESGRLSETLESKLKAKSKS